MTGQLEAVDCIAAFDLDGTLTKRDSLKLFLRSCRGLTALLLAIARNPLLMLRALFSGPARDRAKELVTHHLLSGQPEAALEGKVQDLVTRILTRELRNDTLAWLNWHRSSGHTVIVISASFECYVRPIAEKLGASTVFATRWEVGEDGRLTGRLVGLNMRGAEKARVLKEYIGSRACWVYAYGDSPGDREMLDMADVACMAKGRLKPPPTYPSPEWTAGAGLEWSASIQALSPSSIPRPDGQVGCGVMAVESPGVLIPPPSSQSV